MFYNENGFEASGGDFGHVGVGVVTADGLVLRWDGANGANAGGAPEGTVSGGAVSTSLNSAMESGDVAHIIPAASVDAGAVAAYLNGYNSNPTTTDHCASIALKALQAGGVAPGLGNGPYLLPKGLINYLHSDVFTPTPLSTSGSWVPVVPGISTYDLSPDVPRPVFGSAP